MNYQEINKKNISKWENTLKYLVDILEKENIPYYLSASGLHYILGEDVYPYDIDLFMSKENVRKIYEVLKEYSTSEIHTWEDTPYIEFQGEYNGIPFEICEWEEEPRSLEEIIFKDITVKI
jgi:hypothetical protein